MAFLTKAAAPTAARDALSARNGARWFYWIAGLTVVNSAVAFAGSSIMMLFGMTSTLVATYIGINIGGPAMVVGMVISVLVALGFVGLGWKAERGAAWAFITGLVIYGLDSAASLYFKDWFAAVAHVFAIAIIFAGLRASQRLHRAGSVPGLAVAGGVPGVAAGPGGQASTGAPGVPGQVPPAPLSSAPAGFAEAKAPAPLD